VRHDTGLVHRLRSAALAVGTVGVMGVGAGGCSQEPPREDGAITVPAESKEELERAKLAAEIAAIRSSDENQRSPGSQWLRGAPFITALVGLGTLAAAILKQGSETRLHRSKELAEQRAERTRRYDQTLNSVVSSLGSDDERVRLNAAAALGPLLRLSESAGTADESATPWAEAVPAVDLLPVFIANLRAESNHDVIDILVRNLGLTLVKLDHNDGVPNDLDLTRLYVRRLRIPGVTIIGMDVAFSAILDSDLSDVTAKRMRGLGADLSKSRFTGANLQEARLNKSTCVRTRFHKAQLVSATFKGATLTGAQFHQARLQSSHLEDATCLGTNFTEADVADAWFCDSRQQHKALLDTESLLTLGKARNWRDAHLPAEYRAYLTDTSAANPTGV
jgi:uncharacterized protein YjbI with pentapeptide repeats